MTARKRIWLWLSGIVLVPLVLLACFAWWAGREGSLARALELAQRFLPDDQRLALTDAQGSLSGGGRVARLQWSKPGVSVTIEDLRLGWSLRQLFGRDLRITTLSARQILVRLTPHPEDPEPFVMPEQVSLPIRITVPLNVARVQIDSIDANGSSGTQVINDIAASYRFDGAQHVFRLSSLRYGQSHLQAEGQMDAESLALSSQVAASLRDLTPDTPFAMLARLQIKGELSGGDAARLDVQLDARQQDHSVPPPDASSLLTTLATLRTAFGEPNSPGVASTAADAQVRATATVHPWRSQPAEQLDLQLRQVNAHAFHNLAPITALHGQISIRPIAGKATTDWDAVLDFTNDQAGAWNLQHLPLRKLTARAHLSRESADIEAARLDLGGRTPAGSISLTGRVPLQQLQQTGLQLNLDKVNLQPLMTNLPATAFTGAATVKPAAPGSSQVQADIRNSIPGPLDRDRAPLNRLLADIRIAAEQWQLKNLQLQSGTGSAEAQGEFTPQTQALNLHGELQQLPLRQIHRKMADDAAILSGTFSVAGNLQQRLAFQTDISSDGDAGPRSLWEIRALQVEGNWAPTRLTIERTHLDAFQAQVDASGIDVVLPGFDSIKAKLNAVAPGIQLDADTAMLQQSGSGNLSVQLASAEQTARWLRGLPVIGSRLPDLQATGAANLKADWHGGWKQWLAGIRNPAAQPQLRVNASAHTDGLRIDLPAIAQQPPTHIDVQKLDLNLHGNLAAATLAVDGDARANDVHARVDIRMKATQVQGSGAPRWNFAMEKFIASANLPDQTQPWQLQLSDNLQVTLQPGADIELRATAGSATVTAPASISTAGEPLKISWQPVLWRRTASGANTLESTGTVAGIQPAWLDALIPRKGEGPLAGAGMRTDLSLSGDWDVRMKDSVSIRAHVKRERGDLWLLEPEMAAGIRAFDMQVHSTDENVNLAVNWDTERAGIITAKVGTRLQQQTGGWSLPDDAPLSGNVQARVKDLTTWAFLAPPGWRLAGSLDANVRLAGTVGTPQLNGDIAGKGLNLRSVLDGVDLHDGTLRATLDGARMQVAELSFEGATGSRAYVRGFSGNLTQPPSQRGRMTASGSIDWSRVASATSAESGIAMDLKAKLARMQVLARNDRQMTLSGDLSADLKEGALRIRGDLTVDRASIVLPEASAPKLGDDVVIVRDATLKNPGATEARQTRGEFETRKPMDLEIKLDLGNDLALEGQGITTRLEGELTVRSATYGNDPFHVFGEVRTVQGRYRAWGQALNVETGVVRFNGPYTNPSLNLLAIRPEIEVRAGVQVTGTLNAPRVQLYSDPDLPEGEKLSWVVLGRATVIAGAEGTSMQQAALGLAAGQLSGKLASGLGLDELGLGETGVTIGKRLSNEFYLTYEQGLAGAASTLFLFYDITRRLTVRAQTGEASAVDMIYTIKYD
jgi:translocation and assembly module TamB